MFIISHNNNLITDNQLQLEVNELTNIYEVLRCENGVLLFVENHFNRLLNSFKIVNYSPALFLETWVNSAYEVINANKIKNANLRFDYYISEGEIAHTVINPLVANYPTKAQYNQGIALCLQTAQRINPNAKITNSSLRNTANSIIETNNSYESLLVNNNLITEGSRSNFFAIKNNTLITAPNELVLPGIMRNLVIEVAKSLRIDIDFRAMDVGELNEIEAAFITGTSPRVLAVNQIDQIHLNPKHHLITKLSISIDNMVADYIKQAQLKK